MFVLRHTPQRLKNIQNSMQPASWRMKEDIMLLELVKSNPSASWEFIADYFPGKNCFDCQYRHMELIRCLVVKNRKNTRRNKKKVEKSKKTAKETVLFPNFYFFDQLEIFQNFPTIPEPQELNGIDEPQPIQRYEANEDDSSFLKISVKDDLFPNFLENSFENIPSALKKFDQEAKEIDLLCNEILHKI
eukprot:gene8553-376_t